MEPPTIYRPRPPPPMRRLPATHQPGIPPSSRFTPQTTPLAAFPATNNTSRPVDPYATPPLSYNSQDRSASRFLWPPSNNVRPALSPKTSTTKSPDQPAHATPALPSAPFTFKAFWNTAPVVTAVTMRIAWVKALANWCYSASTPPILPSTVECSDTLAVGYVEPSETATGGHILVVNRLDPGRCQLQRIQPVPGSPSQSAYERVPTIVMDGDHITSVYAYLPWTSSLSLHDWQAQVYTHHLQTMALQPVRSSSTAVESTDLVMCIARQPSETQLTLYYRRFMPQYGFDFTPIKRVQATNWEAFSRRLAPLVAEPLSLTTAPVLHGGFCRRGPATIVEFTLTTVPFDTVRAIPGVWIYGAGDVHDEAVHRICLQSWQMHLADHQSDSDDNPAEWLNSSRILLAMITPDPAGLDPQAPRFHACFYDVTVKSLPVAFQLWGCDAVVDRAPELCTTNVTPMKPHISLPIWIRDKHCQVQALTDDAFTRACSWVLGPTQRLVSLDDGYLAAESQAIPSTGSTSSSIESLPDPARQRSDSTNECDGSYPCPSNDHSPSLSQQSSPPSPTSSPAQPTPHIAMDGTDVVQPRAELPVSLPAVAVTTTAVGADSSLPTSALNLGTAAAPAPLPPNASAEQVLIAQQRTIIHLLQQQLDVFSQQRQFAAPAPWRNQQMHRLEGADDFAAHDPELHEPYYTHEVNDREPGHHPPLPENAMLAAGTPARSITRKYVRVNQPGIQTAAAQAMTSCPEHGTGNVACYNHPQESQQEPGVITSHRTTALAPAMARAPHNSHAREPYQPETSGNGGMVMEAYEETEYITHYLPAHSSRAGPGQMHTRRYRAARMGHMPIHSSTHPTHYEDFTSQPPSHRLRAPSAKSLPPPTTDPMQALMSRVNDVLSVSTSVSTTNSPPVTSAVPHGTHSAGLAHPLLPPRPSIKPTGASAPVGITAPASSLLHDLTPMTKKYLQNLRQRN